MMMTACGIKQTSSVPNATLAITAGNSSDC